MKEIRILFTGIGRRIELVQSFRNAALTLEKNLKIFGADMTGTAPALAYCDFNRKVCSMRDENYIPELIKICMNDQIDLVIPTIDTDLLILAQNIEKFRAIGTKVLISEPDKIALCRDKNYTADFFNSCGLKAPCTVNDYRNYTSGFPCFIKPKDGSSSINAFKVENAEELELYAHQIEDYVIQPFIEGTEYTIDIFCDFDGNPIYITPRIRLAVRAGEVLKTQIVMDEQLITESKKLIERFKPCGPITVQLIRTENNEDYFIEINPRYGGGVPLSMKAGARSAEAVLKLLIGEEISYQDTVDDGAVYSRFDQSVCVKSGNSNHPIRGIIFDLDDTLYSEKQYIKSGYSAVAKFLGDITYAEKLWQYFEAGQPAIDALLKEIGREDKKDDCLITYREHTPQIMLYDGVKDMLKKLRADGVKIGIITDGRVAGQKNKIEALELASLIDDIIITDELGGVQFRKPCDIAFRIMQRRWKMPFESIVYVGDNPIKDFQAPLQLGMKSIFFNNTDGLYNSDFPGDIENVTDILSVL